MPRASLRPGPWLYHLHVLALVSSSSCTQKERPLTHQQCSNETVRLVIQVAWEMPSCRVPSARCSLLLPEKILPAQPDMASILAWKGCCWGGSASSRPCKASMRSLHWGFCWDTVVIAQWTFLIPPSMYSYKLSAASAFHNQSNCMLQIRVYPMLVVGCPLPVTVFGWSLTHMRTTPRPQQLAQQCCSVLSAARLCLHPQSSCFTGLGDLVDLTGPCSGCVEKKHPQNHE